MKLGRYFAAISIIVCAPGFAGADVIITEVAWMGSASNANAEWIELYNTGADSVPLDGWTLIAEDGSPNIPLSGTIGATGFLLLERTSDDTVPGITGIVYSGSLANGGETLNLRNSSGIVVDSVVGGTNWSLGGDNTTKHTAQRTSGGWITAAPSPGVAASGGISSTPATSTPTITTTATTSAQASVAQAPVSSYVAPPVPEVFVDAEGDRTAIVAADIEFNARAYNRDKEVLDYAPVRFHWNFGDGSTAEGSAVLHHYQYPGKYAVVVTIAHDKSAASDRFTVTAEPAQIAFSSLPDGGVAIENRAGRDLDLSLWIIRSFGLAFTLPEDSIVLEGETLRIPQKTLGFWSGASTELGYPNGALALKAGEISAPIPVSFLPSIPSSPPPVVSKATQPAQKTYEPAVPEVSEPDESEHAIPQTAAAADAVADSEWPWWLAAFALAGLSAAAIYVARRYAGHEWRIEDTSK